MKGAAQSMKLTYDDFVLFPDDGKRHELIDGEHYVTPSPNTRHQRISGRLHLLIANWLASNPLGEIFYAPFDIVFTTFDVVEPDLLYMSKARAAEILTDTIINEPARRATDRLFGLNVFEIDPIISGTRLNPGARLTVGRQINNNLRVTYATNLSQDQNQVLALEYRVSNKLSFVAQYEQRSLSNVTRDRDNFSFEVRFRRRF